VEKREKTGTRRSTNEKTVRKGKGERGRKEGNGKVMGTGGTMAAEPLKKNAHLVPHGSLQAWFRGDDETHGNVPGVGKRPPPSPVSHRSPPATKPNNVIHGKETTRFRAGFLHLLTVVPEAT